MTNAQGAILTKINGINRPIPISVPINHVKSFGYSKATKNNSRKRKIKNKKSKGKSRKRNRNRKSKRRNRSKKY